MTKLAIFDCDGTLVDSGGNIYTALAASLTEHGLKVPPPATCRKIIGLNLVEAMAELLPEVAPETHVELAGAYKAHFHQLRASGVVDEPLFDGVIELLDRLEAQGWLLAVATGKSDRGLRHCLEANGIHARFVSLQTADRHPSKPHPSMAQVAMRNAGATPDATVVIGDTSFDMGMAKAAGAMGIGAGWGYHSPDELIAAGAAAVAMAPLDVFELMETGRG